VERSLRPGVLLDRDGTIIVDYHYVGHIERVQFIPGAIEAIRRFNNAGIPVAIVTNQGGVARGFYDERNVSCVHAYIEDELAHNGAHVDLIRYSPHHPDGNVPGYNKESYDHKPNPGMALYAAEILDLDLTQSFVVGDRKTDVELARNIGADAIYLGAEPLPHWYSNAGIYQFQSLADAAGYIIERITGVSTTEFPTMNYSGINGFFQHYSDEITTTLSRMGKAEVEYAAEILYQAYSDGSTVWVAGNGGAAAIADHMAIDHAKHTAATVTLFSGIHSLSANNAVTTALANDIGYDAIYSWQLEQFATKHDVLVVFSVSGESKNIIRVLQCAKEQGIKSIAIVGGEAVTIEEAMLASCIVHIPATNYGVVEDIMSIIQHSLAQYIRQTQMTDLQIQSARF
jgi:D-sedoheptulose 7-phosphate isomerase/D-glycero-D-manno-heptose 1,7-bisphosphate phosphatase